MQPRQKLHRSDDRVLAGVCGGIAEHLGVSPTKLRIAYVVLSFVSAGFPGILAYLLLWYLLPVSPPGFRLEDFRVQ